MLSDQCHANRLYISAVGALVFLLSEKGDLFGQGMRQTLLHNKPSLHLGGYCNIGVVWPAVGQALYILWVRRA
jgi:hypothetical protein